MNRRPELKRGGKALNRLPEEALLINLETPPRFPEHHFFEPVMISSAVISKAEKVEWITSDLEVPKALVTSQSYEENRPTRQQLPNLS